jgi:hypothetical protein
MGLQFLNCGRWVRKPKECARIYPGDLVHLDMLDIRLVTGIILKQFTARDVISKWDVIGLGTGQPQKTQMSSSIPCTDECPFQ